MKNFIVTASAAMVVLCQSPFCQAATPDQVGTFVGKLTAKGVNPLTGDKISTKSVVALSIASDNSTIMDIDGNSFYGWADNSFGSVNANLVLLGTGPTMISAPISFKKSSIKGSIISITFDEPYIVSTGKLKLKLDGPGHVDFGGVAFDAGDVPKAITDMTTTESLLELPPLGLITDVNVAIDITHTFDGDLDIFLESPSGTVVELSTDNGAGGDNYSNTVFDDEGGTQSVALGVAPFIGRYRPETPLRILRGEESAGNWKLRISDDANVDTGTLQGWSLTVNSESLIGDF